MYNGKKIGVVIPCYNEERQVVDKVLKIMPGFVDKMIVVDDKSTDNTVDVVKEFMRKDKKKRVELICHEKNQGVGGAISSGYIWCRENNIDAAAVMAGDGQMDPEDLSNLLDPIVEDKTDYAKGNRLVTGDAWNTIPKVRYFGNSALTLMTKIASGYWHVTDSQTGYTVLNRRALHLLPLENIYRNYGMPNDFLTTLNIYDMRVMDIPINPLYRIGETSKMVIHKKIIPLFLLMIRLFLKRMVQKYIIRDFHPLVFFYFIGFLLMLIALPLIFNVVYVFVILGKSITPINALGTGFFVVMSLQFLLFAMWFDMDYNRQLNPIR
jgi:glycosyltransferase involved in cell wall biosynthesis